MLLPPLAQAHTNRVNMLNDSYIAYASRQPNTA